MPDSHMDDFLKTSLAALKKQASTPNANNKHSLAAFRMMRDFVIKYRKQGHSYQEIFSEKTKEFLEKEASNAKDFDYKKYKRLQKKRNRAMVSTINASSQTRFSVLIAGRGHVVDEHPPHDFMDSKYINKELTKGRHQNSYAVLAMKR